MIVVPPIPPASPWLALYVLVAAFMVVGNLYFFRRWLPRGGGTPNLGVVTLVLGLLVMSFGLWASAVYAVVSPGQASEISLFIAGNSMMAIFGSWLIAVLFRAERKFLPARGWAWPLTFALLVVGDETMMGVAFVLTGTGTAPFSAAGWAGLAALAGAAVESVWFAAAMVGSMAYLVHWVPLAPAERRLLWAFTATAAIGPWVIADPLAAALAMAAAMGLVLALIGRERRRRADWTLPYLRTAVGVSAALATMVLGEVLSFALSAGPWGPVPFGVATALAMGGELFFLTRRTFAGPAAAAAQPIPLPSAAETLPPAPAP